MEASPVRSVRGNAFPWEGKAPPLELIERGQGPPVELAWHRTILFVEDLWASAAEVREPDANDVPVRLRPLLRGVRAHASAGYARLPLDDLQRAAEFLEPPLRSILARPSTRLARAHEHVRWERLDELDARSLAWLSRLPGRTTREKSASTRRALGVVRAHTPDVAENRVLVRLARDLCPCLERRLEMTREAAAAPRDRARHDSLQDLVRLLRDELPRTLPAIAPALRPEPNNALLGSGHYGKVWRAWRWLVHREQRFTGLWGLGPPLLRRGLGLLAAECLARRADAFVVDDLATLRLTGDDTSLGIAPAAIDVLLLSAHPRCVSIQIPVGGEPLRVVIRDPVQARTLSTLEVEVSFAPERIEPGRGCPVRVAWLDAERDLIDECCGWFDADGVAALVDPVVVALELEAESAVPGLVVAGCCSGGGLDLSSRFVSADLAPAVPLIADESGVVAPGASCVAMDFRREAGRIEKVVGDDALAMQVGRDPHSRFFLAASWDIVAAGECSVADLTAALGPLVAAASHADCELCIPVPDALGEPGEALLRAALPSHLRRAWLMPRAVAAAMALRASASDAIAVDEPLLILDGGPLGFEGRLAVLRAASASRGPDPCFWDCPLPWPSRREAKPGATRAFWQELTREAVGPDATQAYVDLLVDSGVAAWVATDLHGRPGAALSGPGMLGPAVAFTSAAIAAAAERYVQRFRDWLDALRDALAEATAVAGQRRLHVLVVGELLALPGVAAGLRAECGTLLPEAVLHVQPIDAPFARGGVEFLRRTRAGSPTFELALPDLYLKVIGAAGVATSRPIFQGQRVRPGQEVSVAPLPFEIPAGVPRIELPLEREPGGQRPLAFRAVLDGEGFPLRAPMRVDLHITYRYADDGFRIRIRPRQSDDQSANFAEREVRWLRAESAASAGPICNDPPGFPPRRERQHAAAGPMPKTLETFGRDCDRFLENHVQGQRGDEGALARQLEQCAREVAALTAGAPSHLLEERTLVTVTDAWVTPLGLLADVVIDPYRKRRLPRWTAKAGELRKQLPRLCAAALVGLSRLGAGAPRAVPRRLLEKAERRAGRPFSDTEWMCLGRTIHALPDPDRGCAAIRVVDLVCDVSPHAFAAWWALATALWSDESLVLALTEESVQMLLARIEAAVTTAPRLDLLHEIGIVLLALLRRRGRAEAGPIDAGTPLLRRLADQFEDMDRALFAKGQRREPRLKIVGQITPRADVSGFIDSLTAALRGERVALIRMLED